MVYCNLKKISSQEQTFVIRNPLNNFIDACVNNMDLSDGFSEEKSEQGMLGTYSDHLTSNQFNNNISFKIENDAYPSAQENDELYEIQSNTEEQFTKNEDLCVVCGHVSAYEFFSFPINADIRQQWAKFCDINLDRIKPHFRLCDGHFKPEDYQISMQRRVLMPTSVPTLRPKVKHNFMSSISQSFQFGTDVISFSMPKLNINTSQNTICSSDFERNTTIDDAPNKELCENFKDITNNQDTIPPKTAKSTSTKNWKHEKCHLLEKNLRSEIFRLKIRCSRLEDTVANFENKIKQQVEECLGTRTNTAGNVARDIQNSTLSINASSEKSVHNLCNTEARTDQRSVKDALVGSAEHVTEDGYCTDTSVASLAISIDDPQTIEVKSELFTEEVRLDEPAEKVAEDNHFVNSTISPREISTDRLHYAKANFKHVPIRVNAETSRIVAENNRYPVITFSSENSNSRRCSTEDSLEQHFEEAPPEPEYSDEDSQSPNSTIPFSEKSLERRNNVEARAGCSKNQENSGQGRITRSAKQKKHLPSVEKPTRNSSSVSNKVEGQMQDSFPYCCDICGTKSSSKRDWTRHQQQEHSKPFHCQVCNKQFAHKSRFIAHGLTHSEKKDYKCSICDARFKHNFSKLKHERMHAKGGCFECPDCGKKFSDKHHLIRHLRLHSGVKPFSCQTCGKSFTRKDHLTQHQRIHSKEKPFKCRICNKHFSHQGAKAEHERFHVKVPLPSKVVVQMQDSLSYCCDFCGIKFSCKRDWTRHQHQHTKPFHCQVCAKQFPNKSSLIKHGLTHSENKPFKCRLCDVRFKSNTSKLTHERVHHVEGARFECAICGVKVLYKGHLVTHLRVHSGEKPFSCQKCSKRFSLKCNLIKHQRTHSRENPFKCRICNKKFKGDYYRTVHERSHAKGPRFECAHCGNKFRCERTLANHVSSKCN
ncbi:zinc finger protein 37-like isoform X2 [Planococcus citri]|uniref:zinc finger protein 37-like isoform X2 n=1 Tax=Planococcus citri TaxID=170843 RepID=UPI0031F92D1D